MHRRQAFLLLLETLDGVLRPRQLVTESAQIIDITEDVQQDEKKHFLRTLLNGYLPRLSKWTEREQSRRLAARARPGSPR